MKKIYLLLSFLCSVGFLQAQTVVDCNSGRYDTEVFSAVVTTSDINFGSNISSNGLTTQLTMDVYEPSGDTAAVRPLIVWAHGGSFVGGTKADPDIVSLCNHFAKRGYVCASINYRLGIPIPPSQLGATQAVYRAVQDMKAAIRYFRKDAATANVFHIDPNLIVAAGSSAGAFTALHLAYLDDASEIPTSIDTVALGGLEGNSGNPGYPSNVSAVVNLCGAIGDKTYLQTTDEPLCSMHGTVDNVVPYATATIYLFGSFPLMVVDGSYSINEYADQIGMDNTMYTFFDAGHVPYLSSTAYMDTTVRFVSNFLYEHLGCTPTDPTPLANTFNGSTGVTAPGESTVVEVFPQPAAEQVVLRSQDMIQSVEMTDMTGRVVLSKKVIQAQETVLSLHELSAGTYFIRLETAGAVVLRKVVKR